MGAPNPVNEELRIHYLKELNILDAPPVPSFDNIVKLASEIFDMKISLVSLVDTYRQWFFAKIGLDACETDREHAFCAYAILKDEVLEVPNALEDERFKNNPLVTGPLHIRSYYGAPLIMEDGIRIGTLCVIDTEPKYLSLTQIMHLQTMAQQVVETIKLFRQAQSVTLSHNQLAELNTRLISSDVAIKSMNDGLVIQNGEGAIIKANESACRILGLTYEQLTGASSFDPRWSAIDIDGNHLEGSEHPSMRAIRTGKTVSNSIMGVNKPDGTRSWLQVSATPLFHKNNPKPTKVVVTFTDITVIKELKEVAQAANLAKSAFLANMSHEIRTPLNGVIGIAGALCKTDLNDKQSEMIKLIQTSGETLNTLLNDILDYSKAEAGEMKIENITFSLEDAIKSAANLLKIRADEKGVRFNINTDEIKGKAFIGDAVRIRQVIGNLSSNAVKFTEKGQIDLNTKFYPDKVEIIVRDTGIGMNDEAISNLFQRFKQADDSITRKFGGTGLGLSICKSIIDLMEGNIEVCSQEGIGTKFTVTIPLKEVELSKSNSHIVNHHYEVKHEENLDNDNFYEDTIKVLLVEDNLMNQKVFTLMTESFGFEITYANDGKEGLEYFKAEKYDVIFMDMQMPIMDGLTATKEIRELEKLNQLARTPIIMLTANSSNEYVKQGKDVGADLHCTKPFTIESLSEVIEECFALDNDIALTA